MPSVSPHLWTLIQLNDDLGTLVDSLSMQCIQAAQSTEAQDCAANGGTKDNTPVSCTQNLPRCPGLTDARLIHDAEPALEALRDAGSEPSAEAVVQGTR